MTYTEEQIKWVCEEASSVMKDFTDVQNCTFPSTQIIDGMNKGLTAEEIGNNAYDSIAKLPLHQTGFGLVGMGDTMHNAALYMQSKIMECINTLNATPTP